MLIDLELQSLTEKQAKEIRESKEGRNLFLENLNNRYIDMLNVKSIYIFFMMPFTGIRSTALCFCLIPSLLCQG